MQVQTINPNLTLNLLTPEPYAKTLHGQNRLPWPYMQGEILIARNL